MLAPYVFAFAAVTTDASQAAVDNLDGAQHDLQRPYGQQDGEQDDVPHHNVLRGLTCGPQSLVGEVAAVVAAGDHSRSSTCEEGPKEEVCHYHSPSVEREVKLTFALKEIIKGQFDT